MTANRSFDVAVVGCGGAGSAAAWHAAQRGRSVIALDRFDADHRNGSSHGAERIFRYAYTDARYVELGLAARRGWSDLEAATGRAIIQRTGGIDVGNSVELDALEASYQANGLRSEWLSPTALAARFPGLRFDGVALYQPDAGVVHAALALHAFREQAVAGGASLRFSTPTSRIEQRDGHVTIHAADDVIEAGSCIITTGAWADQTLRWMTPTAIPTPAIVVTKEQVAFFRPLFDVAWPTFIERGVPSVYGLPTPGGLVKVGEHCTGPVVDPDRRTFDVEPATWHRLVEWVRRHMPGVDPVPVDQTTCLYASTADEDFVLDRNGAIVVGIGLGGHGFKFLPEIGRRLADLADRVDWPDNPFARDRMGLAVGPSGHK